MRCCLPVIFFFCLCPQSYAQQRTVRFNTSDGCSIEGFYLPPSSGSYVFINTHGLGSAKEEWAPFHEALKKESFGYLSIDMRGHGKSLACFGKTAAYRTFSAADWNSVSLDIAAAAAWLKAKNIPASKMVYCGASIGANLSLKAAAEAAVRPGAVVLLSPGLEYAGVRTEHAYGAVGPLRILLVASEDDPYAWHSAKRLAAAAKKIRADFKNGGGGHGVNMFKDGKLMSAIIAWARNPKKSSGSN